MPRRMIGTILDDGRQDRLADRQGRRPKGTRVISAAGGLHHHRHPGRQHRHEDQPVLGQVGDQRQAARAARPPTRRARRTTTATSPPTATSPRRRTRTPRRSRSASGWATATTRPNDGKLSLDTSAPLWSAILQRGQQGPRRSPSSSRPEGLKTATVDAFTGLKPGPFTRKTVKELFIAGHRPDPEGDDPDRGLGSTRRAACSGRRAASDRRSRGASSTSPRSKSNFPNWQKANRNWGARAARGLRRARRPEGHADGLLLQRRVRPVRADLGRAVRPDEARARSARRRRRLRPARLRPDPSPRPRADRAPASRRRDGDGEPQRPSAEALDAAEADSGAPERCRDASELDDRRPVAALAALAGADRLAPADGPRPARRTASRSGARPHAVDDQDLVEARPAPASSR